MLKWMFFFGLVLALTLPNITSGDSASDKTDAETAFTGLGGGKGMNETCDPDAQTAYEAAVAGKSVMEMGLTNAADEAAKVVVVQTWKTLVDAAVSGKDKFCGANLTCTMNGNASMCQGGGGGGVVPKGSSNCTASGPTDGDYTKFTKECLYDNATEGWLKANAPLFQSNIVSIIVVTLSLTVFLAI